MGFFTQAYLHSQTDRVAQLLKGQLTALDSALTGATVVSLRDQLNALGDTTLEDAFGSYATAVDEMALPTNRAAALAVLCQLPTLQNYARGLNAVAVANGYANLRAALTDKSAVVHPLYAELHRSVFQEGAFTNGGDVTTVFAPTYGVVAPSRVFIGADGALSDDSTDALDAGTADVSLFGTNGHSVYLGSPHPYTHAIFGLSTKANVTPGYTPSYWNGNAWVSLGATDNSAGMTRNDTVSWTRPGDWVRCYKDAGGTAFPTDSTPLFYTKWTRTAGTLGTPPVATSIRLVPSVVLKGTASHLGVDQPPLGLIRVTGTNAVSVESIAAVDYARFTEPVIILRALNLFGANLTLTLSYVNQAGANQTQAQSAWTAPAALATQATTLNGADTGVRSIRTAGWAATTTNTDGVIAIEVAELRSLAL